MGKAKLSRTLQMKYLIQGLTKDGTVFRPSDWNDRLASALAEYRAVPRLRIVADMAREHKIRGYSNCIMPVTINGIRSIILDDQLKDIEVLAFDFAMNFARDNNLTIISNYSENFIKPAQVA